MAYSLTHGNDYQDVWGRHVADDYSLVPAISDYATGGYLIQGISGTTETTGNVALAKVGYVIPIGGQGGYMPVWNPVTSKLEIYQGAAGLGANTQVPANTDLSAFTFHLLVIGY